MTAIDFSKTPPYCSKLYATTPPRPLKYSPRTTLQRSRKMRHCALQLPPHCVGRAPSPRSPECSFQACSPVDALMEFRHVVVIQALLYRADVFCARSYENAPLAMGSKVQ
jgi:hypothetical protein